LILAINTSIGLMDATAGNALRAPGKLIYYAEVDSIKGEGLPKKRTSVPRQTKARAVNIPTGIHHTDAKSTRHNRPILVKGIAYASTSVEG